MMKTYETRDLVPENLRETAVETKEGKWVVDDGTGGKTEEDFNKLNEIVEKERTKAREEEKARRTAEREAAELKRAQQAREQGISEEALQKIRDDEERARKPIVDENARLQAENRKLKLTDRVQQMALEAGVMPERIKQAMKLLDGRTDLSDADRIVVLDEDGKPTAETPDRFLRDTFKRENPFLYFGTGAQGGGRGTPPEPEPNPAPTPAATAQADLQRARIARAF